MKKFLALASLLVLAVGSTHCEKDDICSDDTPTTPRVILELFNNDVITDNKSVTLLHMRELSSDSIISLSGVSRIPVPLKADADTVTWIFTINPGNPDPNLIRTDTLVFNYTHDDIYVSRACGFKTNFVLNSGGSNPGIIHTPSAPLAWMRNIIIDNHDIILEDETHVRILW